jgi:protein SCO1/2
MIKDKTTSMPKVVAITFDPLRDTPEVLKEYVRHFDKDYIKQLSRANIWTMCIDK